MSKSTALWPGIIFCTVIAVMSFVSFLIYRPISTPMWAFIYSIVLANIINLPESLMTGIRFCSRDFLRGVIASLGIVTSALIWLTVGVGIINAFVVIFVVFFGSIYLGRKLELSDALSTLIGVGTCICGASAIAATAPALNAKEEEVGLALTCITIFSITAMFLYPFLFTSTIVGDWLGHNVNAFAIWVGTGIHEVAGVTAASGALGVAGAAMSIKSIRVFMIGPMVLLATYINSRRAKLAAGERPKLTFPAYGIAFIIFSFCCAFLDSYAFQLVTLGFNWVSIKAVLDGTIFKFLLALCFAGVGSTVRLKHLAKLGAKALGIGALMAVLAGVLALVLTIAVLGLIPV